MLISESFEFEEIKGYRFGYQPIGRPKLMSQIYFIDGLLIDTGHRRVKKEVLNKIKDLDVQHIFVTHYHEDHSGNIDLLQNHFHCNVYASTECCTLMKDPPKISLPQNLLWGTRPANSNLIPITELIETPHYQFELIPIPGHASDMLALYEPNKKWMFSADLYLISYIDYFLYNESIVQQIKSIKKILEYDFDALLCSHNPQFKNGKEKLKKKLKFLEGFNESVLELHNEGYSEKLIMKKLKLKENWGLRFFSGGDLSKLNMVKSVIRDTHIL